MGRFLPRAAVDHIFCVLIPGFLEWCAEERTARGRDHDPRDGIIVVNCWTTPKPGPALRKKSGAPGAGVLETWSARRRDAAATQLPSRLRFLQPGWQQLHPAVEISGEA